MFWLFMSKMLLGTYIDAIKIVQQIVIQRVAQNKKVLKSRKTGKTRKLSKSGK